LPTLRPEGYSPIPPDNPARPAQPGPRHPQRTPAHGPQVLVSDKLSETAVQIFRDRGIDVTFDPSIGKDKDKLLSVIGDYDGLAIRSATKVTEKVIAAATNLKVVGRAGIGVDNVDIPAASKKGIIVMNTPFGNSITTAEHAIAMMFAVARQIPEANASTHAGKWEKSRFMGVELTGKTLGVIGAGNIGSIVIAARWAFAMKVLAYDPFLSEERARRSARPRSELEELLEKADFITLHVPLHREDREHPVGGEPRQDQEGRAHHQLRARRSGRRGGAGRASEIRACRGRGLRRVQGGTGDGEPAVQPAQRRRDPASRAPPPPRRRKTSRCRWPSRCRTTC
jgi:hypothetical protein